MHKSRRELLDDFVAFHGQPSDEVARNIAERLLNLSLQTLWLQRPWRIYRSPVPFELTLTVNQARYALPDYFGRVGPGDVRNLSTGRPVTWLADGLREQRHPQAGTSFEVAGSVEGYEIAGMCGVHTQPDVAGEALEVVSSDTGDTDVVLSISGDDSSGRWTRTQVTLQGTTAVALGTWAFVDEVAKAYVATATPATELTSSRGTVTIRKVSDATEIQRLFSQETAKEHSILTVFPKPATADTLAVPIIRRPKRLLYDADPVPDLWEPALWEEMGIEWQVHTGDLTRAAAGQVPRVQAIRLAAFENQNQPRHWKAGFGG